ncbi:MAG: SIS domain-containing protein [Pseudomonadota bacterium]
MNELLKYIDDEVVRSTDAKKAFVEKNRELLVKTAELFAAVTKNGGKILYFGNGGSAADCQHLAAEHVNKLLTQRKALPALALTTDTSTITSIANDLSFDDIFSRQIEALGNAKDVAFGISTSGNSPNVIKALKKAKEMGMKTIALTGNNGGKIMAEKMADIILNVERAATSPRIQETHIFAGHIVIELMDKILMTK